MSNIIGDLNELLKKCNSTINKGYTNIQNSRLSWLNTFCLEFLEFSQKLHTFLSHLPEKQKNYKSDDVEMIYLCLTQIVTCIKHMENTINAEEEQRAPISAARQHFLDRINWCLDRLASSLKSLYTCNDQCAKLPEERSFVQLMDRVLDLLSLYSSYKVETITDVDQKVINLSENCAQALFDSQEIRSLVDLILGHTLAFANVALEYDKKALSALCQKVLRDCMTFQEECSSAMQPGGVLNECYRKLKASSLENALFHLEDFINEALLRLVYSCFLDFKKYSIDKLRQFIRENGADNPALDDLVADFDVNVDRSTQIGLFAIAFAPNVKIKTTMRSSLASFEALDSCIIPSLQTKGISDIFAKLLEQHFNEEVTVFRNSIQEIIDSQAFAACYFELLTKNIEQNHKTYNKDSLEDIIKMAEILYEHFLMPVNYKQLQKQRNCLELFKKFLLMLQECQAVLKCHTPEVEPQRVLKRFKILRAILRKLIDALGSKSGSGVDNKSQLFLMPDEFIDSRQPFDSVTVSSSTKSILYDNNTAKESRRNHSSLNINVTTSHSTKPPDNINAIDKNMKTSQTAASSIQKPFFDAAKKVPSGQRPRSSIRRKESLRTALFKRQKSYETEQIYNVYKNNSHSLQISEILDQLSGISSNLSKDVVTSVLSSNSIDKEIQYN